MRNYAQLLRRNPDYARLWLAQVISLLGDWFDTITLLALVAVYSPEYRGSGDQRVAAGALYPVDG